MWITVLTESAFCVVVFCLGILWGEDGFLWEVGQKPRGLSGIKCKICITAMINSWVLNHIFSALLIKSR